MPSPTDASLRELANREVYLKRLGVYVTWSTFAFDPESPHTCRLRHPDGRTAVLTRAFESIRKSSTGTFAGYVGMRLTVDGLAGEFPTFDAAVLAAFPPGTP